MTGEESAGRGAQSDTPSRIDEDAPILAEHEIAISAPLRRVWDLHLAVGARPTWQSVVTAAEMHGAFAPSGCFTWTSFGVTVTSTVHAVQDEARTLWGDTGDWGGHGGGITGIRMAVTATANGDPCGDQGVFRRWPGRGDGAGMKKLLDGSLRLNPLKAAAERLR
jgi:hypothetical protein